MMVLIAAAMPYRISSSFPVINSVSILDLLLIAAAITLFLDLAFKPIDLGYRPLFWLLCVPLFVATISVVWSQDRAETLRSAIVYGEGLIAYLFVVRELSGVSADRVMVFIRRYAYLLIIPGILLLLYVPGFSPQEYGGLHGGIQAGDDNYVSYYTRLSHPLLGRSNNLATVLAFLAPLLLYWGHRQRDLGMTVAAFVSMGAIFATQSRGVLLAFLLAAVLYGLFASSRRQDEEGRGVGGKVVAAVFVGIVAIAALYTFNPATQEAVAGRLTLANIQDRSALMSESLDQVSSRPLLGYGAGVNPAGSVVRTITVVSGDIFHEVDVTDTTANVDAHNAYLQQIVYFGIPLGAVFAVSLWAIPAFFLGRRPNPMAGVIAYALMAQLVLFLFESSFEGTVLRVLFYLAIGLAVALLRSASSESPAARSP